MKRNLQTLVGCFTLVIVVLLTILIFDDTCPTSTAERHRGDDGNDIGVIDVTINPLVKEKGNARNISVTVHNFGENETNSDGQPGFEIEVSIQDDESFEVYNESLSVDEVLEMGDNYVVDFNDSNGKDWVPNENGDYQIHARTIWEQDEKNIDENGDNDLMTVECLVEKAVYDISILSLDVNPMTQDVGQIREITTEVRNDGNSPLDNNVEITFTVTFRGSTIDERIIFISLQPDESSEVKWYWQSYKYGEYEVEVTGAIRGESETNLDNNSISLENIMTVETLFSDTREDDESPYYLNHSTGKFILWDHIEMETLFWNGDNETNPSTAGWHIDSSGYYSTRSWYGGILDTKRYSNNMRAGISSQALNLADYSSVHLSFFTKYHLEGAPYDFVEISISNDGESWEELVRFPDTGEEHDSTKEAGNDFGWIHKDIEIPGEFLQETFYIEILMKTDSGVTFTGVWIDDILLYGTSGNNHPPFARFSAYHEDHDFAYSQNVIKNPPVSLLHMKGDTSNNNLPRPIGEMQGGLPLGSEVEFSAGGLSFDPDMGDDFFCRWDFGDGETEFGNTVSHTYEYLPMEGYYIVKLKVTDEYDAYSEDTIKVWFGNKAPESDFIVASNFDTSTPINDENDGMENSIIDVFYGDRIIFIQKSSDPENDPLTFQWEFECDLTQYETSDIGDVVSGIVGEDFLYEGLDGSEPIKSVVPVNYTVTLLVNDGHQQSVRSYTVQVHPYARATFKRQVTMDSMILNASVELIWRGFSSEAAPSKELISPERPVFVYIEPTDSPDPSLGEKGGIGLVYEVTTVGCMLQNGDEGFIKAEIILPILTSDIEEIGEVFVLQDDLRLEYYDAVEKRFIVVEGSEVISEEGIIYVIGDVDHFSIFTVIVDSIYNPMHPDHDFVLPELMVSEIKFSRTPVLNGQIVEIRAHIKNNGLMHAKNVDVNFYDDEFQMSEKRTDVVKGSGGLVVINLVYEPLLNDPDKQLEEHTIRVAVNEQRSIVEANENYENNEQVKTLHVIKDVRAHQSVVVTDPEENATVNRTIIIRGNSSVDVMIVSIEKVYQSFGNGDCIYTILSVEPESVPVFMMEYSLVDDQGTIVNEFQGSVADIYGLNFDDGHTNVTFRDYDLDGDISIGDAFLLRGVENGGVWMDGYTLQLHNLTNSSLERVEVSINEGTWMVASGTNDWILQWDTTTMENGFHSLRFRSYCYGAYSDIVSLNLDVQNQEQNIVPIVGITEPLNEDTVSGNVTIQGIAVDKDGNETIEVVEISINDEEWIAVMGTSSWGYSWNTTQLENGSYTISVRCYDGTLYSDILNITVIVKNEENTEDDTGDGRDDKGEDSDDNLLFEQIGPLPLFGYVGLLITIGLLCSVLQMKKGSKTRSVDTPSPPSQQPNQQAPQPTSQPPIQYPSIPLYQDQTSQQEYGNYQPQPSVTETPAMHQPVSRGQWQCPQCGNNSNLEYAFCMKCGIKRDS